MERQPFVPRDYDVFAGLDVDKRSIAVTFTDHQGVSRSMRIPYSVEHLWTYVRKHFAGQKVAFAYEAGPTGYGLYDGLVAHGAPCVVAAPSMIPKAPGQRVKTNRLDSRGLSETLRGGQLKSIHVPTPPYRDLRHLTQLRDTFVRELVGMKLRLKALLLLEGIAFPPAPAGSQWSGRVKQQLRTLACSGTVRFKLDQLLDSVEFSEQQVLKTTREIRRFCQHDPELARCIALLRTIPGIGWLVASQLVARIGDWRVLDNVRQLGGFLGVVPSERSTGEKTERGSITRTGDSRLRSKLIQAAWSAIPTGRRAESLLPLGVPDSSAPVGGSGRHRGGGAEAHDAHRRGLDAAASVCGPSKSACRFLDRRGDTAPGNDSTTGRTGRITLLRVDA